MWKPTMVLLSMLAMCPLACAIEPPPEQCAAAEEDPPDSSDGTEFEDNWAERQSLDDEDSDCDTTPQVQWFNHDPHGAFND